MESTATTLRTLIAAAKAQPHNAATLWQAARIILNAPASDLRLKETEPTEAKSTNQVTADVKVAPLKAEFDYNDENGLLSHRTVYVMALTDGRDVKRNEHLPVADRYGYLLTGYCTLRKQIRSFRSSRISNLRTFTEGKPLEANRQWRPKVEALAS